MSLSALLTVLPAPQHPSEVPTPETWSDTERQLGQLPEDYKAFLGRFGTGTIGDFIGILNPASKNPHLNLLVKGRAILSALIELRDGGEPCPYPLFPDPGGLLPFGVTDNGDMLLWLTAGEPRRWSVVVNAGREPTYETFECDMTDFVAGILTGRLHCSVFPDLLSSVPTFAPALPYQ